MDKKVCVVIVTYNRKKYLLKLILEGLMRQTYPIEEILIVDNKSTDGTDHELISAGIIKSHACEQISENVFHGIKILYYQNKENQGGAGGFHWGIKLASEQGCNLIWAMDDDVLPETDCLEKLINNISDSTKICVPCRTDDKYLDYAIVDVNMSNPFRYNVSLRKKRVCSRDIIGDSINIKDMPFEGPLIDVSIIKKIGLPKKELFIFFDDSEFAHRASRVTNIQYIKSAILHKQIIPTVNPARLMGWREYYSYRNQYWYDRTYGKNIFVKILRPILNHIDLCLRAIIKRKWSNIVILNKAFNDGRKGVLGKTVEPNIKIK